jgi:hypothetical protein
VKTLSDIERVIDTIGAVAIRYIDQRCKSYTGNDWHITPPAGVRVPLPGNELTLVLQGHQSRCAMVAVTLF